jgi:hypothetical protein
MRSEEWGDGVRQWAKLLLLLLLVLYYNITIAAAAAADDEWEAKTKMPKREVVRPTKIYPLFKNGELPLYLMSILMSNTNN